MHVDYLFKKALKVLASLNEEEKSELETACLGIKSSQNDLLAAADGAMAICTETCRGLCCKNLDLDTVFTLWDFIYILSIVPEVKTSVAEHLAPWSTPSGPAPCPFLKNGDGPCLFPGDVKPELCAVTFCSTQDNFKKEIRRVSLGFFLLACRVQWWRGKKISKVFVPG